MCPAVVAMPVDGGGIPGGGVSCAECVCEMPPMFLSGAARRNFLQSESAGCFGSLGPSENQRAIDPARRLHEVLVGARTSVNRRSTA